MEILHREGGKPMDYILRDIDIELWSKVKVRATLKCKTMRKVIFESLKWYITPVGSHCRFRQKEKGEKERLKKKEGLMLRR